MEISICNRGKKELSFFFLKQLGFAWLLGQPFFFEGVFLLKLTLWKF